jgi:phosphoglycolate phosphatase-like HAD superfamily hydrolase
LLPNLTHQEHVALQADCFKFAENNINILTKYIKPNNHALKVISEISKTGNTQIVISNTRQSDLIWFLDSIDIKSFFKDEYIIGVNAHQTHKTKVDALTKVVKDLQPTKVVVIGDSENDLKMGKAVSATTYFYKHPHREHENTKNADYIIKDLRAVLKEL